MSVLHQIDCAPRKDVLASIRQHRDVALRIARGWLRKLPGNVLREDLEQAALIGLWEWKRNHPDETDPGWIGGLHTRIRGSIVDELRRQDWLPRYAHKGAFQLRVLGLDDVDANWDDHWAGPAASADSLETKQAIAKAMRAPLTGRDAQVVNLIYFRNAKFKDAAAQLGVSEPRISQLHSRAIRKLRAQLQDDQSILVPARRQLERAAARAAKGTHGSNEHSVCTGAPARWRAVIGTLPEEGVDLVAELSSYQNWMVDQAMARALGNKAKAAKLLGLNRTTFVEMLKRSTSLRVLARQRSAR
jgi:RNA polymerase sigma factor (sigma-70 family)